MQPAPRIGIVILAAGESRRMGAPKPLRNLAGKRLLEHILTNTFLSRDSVHPVVVLGHEADRVRRSVPPGVVCIENREYEKGRLSSVQCGLRALPGPVEGAFIWPVDCPLVPGDVLEALTESFTSPESICVPSYDLRRGHPPLIGAAFFQEIESMGPDESLRELYSTHSENLQHVIVDSEAILHNLNTPDELQTASEWYTSHSEREVRRDTP